MNKKEKPASRPARRTPKPQLGRELQSKIGQQLREMHDDVVREGVPSRFLELLAKLDQGKKE
jgi:hypothetical protein